MSGIPPVSTKPWEFQCAGLVLVAGVIGKPVDSPGRPPSGVGPSLPVVFYEQ